MGGRVGLGRLSCSFGFGRGLTGILVSGLLFLFRLTTTSPEHGGVHDGWITLYGLPALVTYNGYICFPRCLWTSYLNAGSERRTAELGLVAW